MADRIPTVSGGNLILAPSSGDAVAIPTIAVDSPMWWAWLAREDTSSFNYEAGPLRFIARRRFRQGMWRWYATRWHQGKRREVVLGDTAELTSERLQQAADTLARVGAPDASRHFTRPAAHTQDVRGDHAAEASPTALARHEARGGRSVPTNDDPHGEAGSISSSTSRVPPMPLLATKLFIPHPRHDLVPRPRLLDQLADGVRGPLTVLAAPAGWGKTTVVVTWCATACNDVEPRRPVGWLSLDTGDNDPVRFWTYAFSALNAAQAGIADDALRLLRTSQPPAIEAALTLLLNALTALTSDVVLVLDDYHIITTAAIHSTLAYLLEHIPPQLHVVLVSREDPPLRLSRLRANSAMCEIRAADLRFTSEEVARFLTQMAGIPLKTESLEALEARTEGWITGLQLAALSVQGRSPERASDFIARFGGSNRYIVDYLIDEVVTRQPPTIQDFLLRTAVVDRICAPLCEVLLAEHADAATPATAAPDSTALRALPTGHTGTSERRSAQGVLEQLDRTNLFLIPLDDERRWYRYHHLFADMLRSRLQQAAPGLSAVLCRRASGWFEQQGLVEEAVTYALASSDFELAADLIERYGFAMGTGGQVETVLSWLRNLPEAVMRSRPLLCLYDAAMRWEIGQAEPPEARLRDAEAAIVARRSAGDAESGLRPMLGMIALMRSLLALLPGDLSASIAFAREAEDLLPNTYTLWHVAARYYAGRSFLITGDTRVGVEHELCERAAAVRVSQNQLTAMVSSRDLADLQRLQGRLRAAAATLEEALQLLSAQIQMADTLARPGHFFGPAEIRLEWNELDAADRLLTRGMSLLGRWFVPAAGITRGYLALARLQQARGEHRAALETLDGLAKIAHKRGFVPELVELEAAARAQLALATGDMSVAVHWADTSGLSADDQELPFRHEPAYLSLARVRIAQGRDDQGGPFLREAERLLARLLADAESKGRGYSALEILILRALALQARRDTRGALGTIAQALLSAQPEGYVRIFADEGAPMAALLTDLIEAAEQRRLALPRAILEYARALVAACHSQDANVPAPMPPTLPLPQTPKERAVEPNHSVPDVSLLLLDPLTARELEVLRLLVEGASNAAIAAALVVTIGTVKKHVFNVCSKLGADNRTQAVARAHALHLV